MSYLTQSEIAQNRAMRERVAQCATGENVEQAESWMSEHARKWAAAPNWDAAWEYAQATHPPDEDPETPSYDPGADEAVITDGMILAQVQAMIGG